MNDGKIRFSKATRFVPSEYASALKPSRRPKFGDVLYFVTGSIGIAALVETNKEFVFQRHIAILKPDILKTDGRFLSYILASQQVMEQGRAVATGTAQLTIPLSGLRSFKVPYPQREEQHEIVRRIESAFAWLDKVAAEHNRAAHLLPKLDQAILAKAFRGELVPQNPNDKPASELLVHIRSARADAPKQKRGRNSGRKITPRVPKEKAAMTTNHDDDIKDNAA